MRLLRSRLARPFEALTWLLLYVGLGFMLAAFKLADLADWIGGTR